MVQLNDLTYHALIAAAIVALFLLLTRAVRRLLGFLGRKIFARTATVLDDRILDVVLSNVGSAMLVTGLFIAIREIRKGTTPEDVTALQLMEYANAILYVLGVIILLRVVLGILRELVHWYLDRASGEGVSGLKLTLGPLTTKVMNILVGLVAVIIILDHFGINIGSLLVSLGVGSLAVALAAQDTLANMIAGFVILVDRPFRVGDRIDVAGGMVGDVVAIGLRSTRVLNFENNVIIIPNAELVKTRIINYAYPQNQIRVLLRFEVAYGTDTEQVRRILLDLAAAHPDILADPPPSVFVTSLTESAVQLTLVARAREYAQQWGAETTIREQAYAAFLREKIPVPVPQRVVRMAHLGVGAED